MMTGLMMVFLFIAVLFMSEIQKEKIKIEGIVEGYSNIQQKLHAELNREFKDDLEKWGAEILPDNTFRFNSPNILFFTGESQIRVFFQQVLNNFFPRYLNILTSEVYKNEIQEVRIEGHTSSIWDGATKEESYINNMRLSQARAISVLEYTYKINKTSEKHWLEKVFRANGMSFSKLIMKNGVEDILASQRVDFRVLTKAEEKIYEILNELETTKNES